jgi:cell pole-organizing protein PopZ
VKEAVDAGLPLDVVLTKYLAWSDADINAMNETQAAQQPDPAEVAARVAMMQAGQQQARQGTTNEQQGTTQTPQAPGPGANSGAAHQGVGQ